MKINLDALFPFCCMNFKCMQTDHRHLRSDYTKFDDSCSSRTEVINYRKCYFDQFQFIPVVAVQKGIWGVFFLRVPGIFNDQGGPTGSKHFSSGKKRKYCPGNKSLLLWCCCCCDIICVSNDLHYNHSDPYETRRMRHSPYRVLVFVFSDQGDHSKIS